MGQKFRNDFATTLTATITTSSTALALTAAPAPAITLSEADDYFLLTIVDKNGNREIVKCVGISGLNVTIGVALGVPSVDGRAQEDTTAIPVTHTDDHEISMRSTAGTFDAIISDISTLTANTAIASPAQAAAGSDNIQPLSCAMGRVMVDGYAPISTLVQTEGGTNNVARQTPLRSRQGAIAFFGSILEQNTKCIFKQDASPTGWTFLAEDNDRVFMNTDSYTEGGDTGGNWTMEGMTIDGHQLTEDEMPTHVHGLPRFWAETGGHAFQSGAGLINHDNEDTEETGADQEHDHGITNSTWRPAYVKVITCQKD